MNSIILIGNLTRDPEKRTTQSGISSATFTLAVNRRVKGPDGQRVTDFIKCVAWRQTADFIAQYGAKGRKLAVIGELQSRSYEKDGAQHTVWEVIVSNAEFVTNPETKPEPEPKQAHNEGFVEEPDGELPF
ncbi:MAG: single-stranded DNA-binding protein [Clostridia bacterium]|nr:single-stranded DNA-binding protein [Clostridia bacterium]